MIDDGWLKGLRRSLVDFIGEWDKHERINTRFPWCHQDVRVTFLSSLGQIEECDRLVSQDARGPNDIPHLSAFDRLELWVVAARATPEWFPDAADADGLRVILDCFGGPVVDDESVPAPDPDEIADMLDRVVAVLPLDDPMRERNAKAAADLHAKATPAVGPHVIRITLAEDDLLRLARLTEATLPDVTEYRERVERRGDAIGTNAEYLDNRRASIVALAAELEQLSKGTTEPLACLGSVRGHVLDLTLWPGVDGTRRGRDIREVVNELVGWVVSHAIQGYTRPGRFPLIDDDAAAAIEDIARMLRNASRSYPAEVMPVPSGLGGGMAATLPAAPLEARAAEIRYAEDRYFDALPEREKVVSRRISFWWTPEGARLLQEVDRRHGFGWNDSRIYSIASFNIEYAAIQGEQRSMVQAAIEGRGYCPISRFVGRKLDCEARHFPALAYRRCELSETLPELWKHVHDAVAKYWDTRYKDSYEDQGDWIFRVLGKVNLALGRLGMHDLTLGTPYPKYSLEEVVSRLMLIRDELESGELAATPPTTTDDQPPDATPGLTEHEIRVMIDRARASQGKSSEWPDTLPATGWREEQPALPIADSPAIHASQEPSSNGAGREPEHIMISFDDRTRRTTVGSHSAVVRSKLAYKYYKEIVFADGATIKGSDIFFLHNNPPPTMTEEVTMSASRSVSRALGTLSKSAPGLKKTYSASCSPGGGYRLNDGYRLESCPG